MNSRFDLRSTNLQCHSAVCHRSTLDLLSIFTAHWHSFLNRISNPLLLLGNSKALASIKTYQKSCAPLVFDIFLLNALKVMPQSRGFVFFARNCRAIEIIFQSWPERRSILPTLSVPDSKVIDWMVSHLFHSKATIFELLVQKVFHLFWKCFPLLKI